MVLTFESVDKILLREHSHETSIAVLSHGTIYLVSSFTFESLDVWMSEILRCEQIKIKNGKQQ